MNVYISTFPDYPGISRRKERISLFSVRVTKSPDKSNFRSMLNQHFNPENFVVVYFKSMLRFLGTFSCLISGYWRLNKLKKLGPFCGKVVRGNSIVWGGGVRRVGPFFLGGGGGGRGRLAQKK